MLDRLLDPTVGAGVEHAGAGAAGAALEEHDERQTASNVFRQAERAVEEPEFLSGEAGVRLERRGGQGEPRGLGVVDAGDLGWARPAPVERDVDGMVLDVETRQVILGQKRHVSFLSA